MCDVDLDRCYVSRSDRHQGRGSGTARHVRGTRTDHEWVRNPLAEQWYRPKQYIWRYEEILVRQRRAGSQSTSSTTRSIATAQGPLVSPIPSVNAWARLR